MYSMDEELLFFMTNYENCHGQPPTMAEVVEAFEKFSYRSSVRYAFEKLLRSGHLKLVQARGCKRRYAVKR